MKYRIFITLLFCLASFTCKKTVRPFQNEAVITGINPTTCMCMLDCPCSCGGLLFHFTGTTDTSYHILDNPSIFKLGDYPQFPIHLGVDWQNITRCNTAAIKILDYEIR